MFTLRSQVMKSLSSRFSLLTWPTEGVRSILEIVTGKPHSRGIPLDTGSIERIRMVTTVGTNVLLERKGARSALFFTKGFKDILNISNQLRTQIFDLTVATPDLLYQSVVEIDERITREGYSGIPTQRRLMCQVRWICTALLERELMKLAEK